MEEKKRKGKGGLEASVGISGTVEIVVRDKNGKVKFRRLITNAVTTAGKAYIASLLAQGGTADNWNYIGIGNGSSEYHRKSGSVSYSSGSTSFTVSATFSGYSGTQTINKAWLYKDSSSTAVSGAYAEASVSPEVTADWDAGDSLTITWTITIS